MDDGKFIVVFEKSAVWKELFVEGRGMRKLKNIKLFSFLLAVGKVMKNSLRNLNWLTYLT